MNVRHKIFIVLFKYNNFILQCYGKIFLFIKKYIVDRTIKKGIR